MNINFKSFKTKLTQVDQDYLSDKLQSLSKFITDADNVFVETDVDKKHKSGLVFRVEISINPPKFYADARGNDFYEAADLALPKIKEQLMKLKDKKVSLRRRKTKAGKIL